jgi:glutathione S-transferase
MHVLISLPYSPWSERARWALDHHRVSYRIQRYAPVVGEPALRVRLRRLTGRITVPVFVVDGGHALDDSVAIARFADAHGHGAPLFPLEKLAAIERWVALSDRGLDAGRVLSLTRLLGDDEGVSELVPKSLRTILPSAAPRIGAWGVRRTLFKYTRHLAPGYDARATLTAVLDELRAHVGRGTDGTLLGAFTYADVAMTQVLAFVKPPTFGLRIGRASRRSFVDDALASAYKDLLAWRDALYERHRPRDPDDKRAARRDASQS